MIGRHSATPEFFTESADLNFTAAGKARIRVSEACDACKSAKRRCDGGTTCAACYHRGQHCVYTPNKPRGRPRRTPLPDTLISLNPSLRVRPPDMFKGPELHALSSSEMSTAIDVFRNINRITKVVDGLHFFSALQAAVGHGTAVTARAAPSGLRACYFALQCMVGRTLGDERAAAASYESAIRYVESSMKEPPSQHLVSALLMLSIYSISCGEDQSIDAACTFASLARSLSDFVVDMSPVVGFSAAVFARKMIALRDERDIVWPPLRCPIGASPASRALEIASFLGIQFMGFMHVQPQHVPAFFSLLDEALELEAKHGRFFPVGSPLAVLVLSSKALLSIREGDAAAALTYAAAALSAFDPGCALNLPSTFIVAKLLLAVPDICIAVGAGCSSEQEAARSDVCGAALRVLTLPGTMFSSDSLAPHFTATIEDLLRIGGSRPWASVTPPLSPSQPPSSMTGVAAAGSDFCPVFHAVSVMKSRLSCKGPWSTNPPSATSAVLRTLVSSFPSEPVLISVT